jgi:hypothetical protein
MSMQPGIRERWLLLCITLLGSSIIIGSEVNRLPAAPKASDLLTSQMSDSTSNEPLLIKPRHDASQAIAKVLPVLETL